MSRPGEPNTTAAVVYRRRQHTNVLSNQDILIRLLSAALLRSVTGFERERLLWAAQHTNAYGSVRRRLPDHKSFRHSDLATVYPRKTSFLIRHVSQARLFLGLVFSEPVRFWQRGEIVRGLTTVASIWTVAAVGLAVGGGLYFAAGVSTAVIIAILAGIRPLKKAYRACNQSFRL
jgi:putative Mg2+ transporter-C (MgtC) family protein